MNESNPKAGHQSDQNFIAAGILIAICVGLVFWIWWGLHTQISYLLIYPYHLFFELASRFTDYFSEMHAWTSAADMSAVAFSDVISLHSIMGGYLRWALVPVILLMAWHIRFRIAARDEVLKRVMNFDDLIKFQTSEWGAIGMSVNFDPSKLYDGPWAPSIQPMEWIAKHAVDDKTKLIDRERVRIALLDQIGPLWTAYKDQQSAVRVIMAALACHLILERDRGVEILDKVGISLAKTGGISKDIIESCDAMMKNGKYLEPLNAIMRRHAYVSTGMLTLLQIARTESGVIASADFRWLKGLNRTLWYALNGLGRQTTWIESAAIKAHWEIECRSGKPVNQPIIDQAIQAVYDCFSEETKA